MSQETAPQVQSQKHRPHSIGDLIAGIVGGVRPDAAEAYVHDRVEYLVERLMEKLHLPPDEREDLTQDLLMALVQAIPRYNAKRSSWKTFISRVLRRRYCYHLRQMMLRQDEDVPQLVGFDDLGESFGESVVDPAKGGGDPAATADLRIDMEAALARLSPRHQEIAQALMHHSIRKAAKLLNTSPPEIRWAMKRIRECFREANLQVFLGRNSTVLPLA
jgi:RNA polymerase sigma factor (sigma-70 family)